MGLVMVGSFSFGNLKGCILYITDPKSCHGEIARCVIEACPFPEERSESIGLPREGEAQGSPIGVCPGCLGLNP